MYASNLKIDMRANARDSSRVQRYRTSDIREHEHEMHVSADARDDKASGFVRDEYDVQTSTLSAEDRYALADSRANAEIRKLLPLCRSTEILCASCFCIHIAQNPCE